MGAMLSQGSKEHHKRSTVADDLAEEFKSWASSDESGYYGIRIDTPQGNTAGKFFTPAMLATWWEQHGRLGQLYRDLQLRSLQIQDIRTRFLCILSTLILIEDRGCDLRVDLMTFDKKNLDDTKLPISKETVESLFLESYGAEYVNLFYDNQFQFAPVSISTNTLDLNLSPEAILPFLGDELLQDGEELRPTICKYKTFDMGEHPGTNEQLKQTNIVVIKIVPLSIERQRESFKAEKAAYQLVQSLKSEKALPGYRNHFDRFVSCYGAFQQNGFGGIVLEYANGGSLLDYYRRGIQPHHGNDRLNFFKALLDLQRTVAILHDKFKLIHHDIKPGNILVYYNEGTTSQSLSGQGNIRLKLVDFGVSGKLDWHGRPELCKEDRQSTKIYCAPELTIQGDERDEDSEDLPNPATLKTEVWGLGCVMFEAAFWGIRGEAERISFQEARKAEIKREYPKMYGKGYKLAFHNGEGILKAVKNAKSVASNHANDEFTSIFLDYIINNVLHGRCVRLKGHKVSKVLDPAYRGSAPATWKTPADNFAAVSAQSL
ncbi:hypothetical protein PspLS_04619 [Pyricularia sp. CBS 133598]|nr:hypothetical protein PspLS_04619 [Pyricularia sp. CBS 133598]